MQVRFSWLLVAVCVVAGCEKKERPVNWDAGQGGAGGGGDAGTGGTGGAADAGKDTRDAGPADTGADARDAGRDLGVDVGVDASPADAPADMAAADAAADVGREVRPLRQIVLDFAGHVVTYAGGPDGGMPLGFDSSVRTMPVTGSFTYDLDAGDANPVDVNNGRFVCNGTCPFTFTVAGRTVTGSGYAVVYTQNLSSDTFRFVDGPGESDGIDRVMKLDGVAAPTLKLFFAVTDGTGAMLSSDRLPDPFPVFGIGDGQHPHTFTLSDPGGTLLMQLDSLVMR
jgi:hypothetical protein